MEAGERWPIPLSPCFSQVTLSTDSECLPSVTATSVGRRRRTLEHYNFLAFFFPLCLWSGPLPSSLYPRCLCRYQIREHPCVRLEMGAWTSCVNQHSLSKHKSTKASIITAHPGKAEHAGFPWDDTIPLPPSVPSNRFFPLLWQRLRPLGNWVSRNHLLGDKEYRTTQLFSEGKLCIISKSAE